MAGLNLRLSQLWSRFIWTYLTNKASFNIFLRQFVFYNIVKSPIILLKAESKTKSQKKVHPAVCKYGAGLGGRPSGLTPDQFVCFLTQSSRSQQDDQPLQTHHPGSLQSLLAHTHWTAQCVTAREENLQNHASITVESPGTCYRRKSFNIHYLHVYLHRRRHVSAAAHDGHTSSGRFSQFYKPPQRRLSWGAQLVDNLQPRHKRPLNPQTPDL